ncbi:MAG: RNA polymerase sigma factor [Chloroflexi bacterium]|nr:RNA polymerase sigma factor [Chloroflexota bacterium]
MNPDGPLTLLLAEHPLEGFEALFAAYLRPLYSFALRSTAQPLEAEEVAQETFLRAFRALRNMPPAQITVLALAPWLFTIAANVMRSRQRRQRVALQHLEREDGSALEVPATTRFEGESELALLVAALPKHHRLPLVLHYVVGLSYPEIALTLHRSEGTVRSQAFRALAQLRQALRE